MNLSLNNYINISLAAFCFIICGIILIFVITDENRRTRRTKIYILMLFAALFFILTNIAFNIFNASPEMRSPVYIVLTEILKSMCGPLFLIFHTLLILTILRERTTPVKSTIITSYVVITLSIFDILLIIIEPFISFYYYLDENNNMVRHQWFALTYVLLFVCLVIEIVIVAVNRRFFNKKEHIILLSYILIPMLGVIIHIFIEGSAVNFLTITIVAILYFATIQRDLSLEIKKKDLALSHSRTAIMFSQIKPHFLFNSLSSIAQLCDEDPQKAKETIIEFSTYLRNNMDSLSNDGLYSIEKELRLVENYLKLEKAIYGDALNISFAVGVKDFFLPPLTIQPIVENAIKHGIGQREGGGSIEIATYEDKPGNSENKSDRGYFCVTIKDDGVGYDPHRTETAVKDGREYIGINNVRLRLAALCGGSLEINSTINKGTIATIRIPVTH